VAVGQVQVQRVELAGLQQADHPADPRDGEQRAGQAERPTTQASLGMPGIHPARHGDLPRAGRAVAASSWISMIRPRATPVGFQNRAQVADLRVLLPLRSCDRQHRGLVMVRMLYLMFVRLAGWMALLAVACASAPAPLTTPRD
jgi:hypothetical protein